MSQEPGTSGPGVTPAVLAWLRKPLGISGKIAAAFIDSKLTPLLVIFSLALGLFAIGITPREEEPQISVPMIDVFVPYPGATAAEVEQQVATPLERLIWEVPGIDFVYTTSSPNFCLAIARFKVGDDAEQSTVKLYSRLMAHPELFPPGAGPWVAKPRTIDDVPIVALTLHSERQDDFALRRAANELAIELKKIPELGEIKVTGGEPRTIRVELDAVRLRGHGLSALAVADALQKVNWNLPVGSVSSANREILLQADAFLRTVDDARNVVVAVRDGKVIRLGDVAEVADGPGERSQYVFFGSGPATAHVQGSAGQPESATGVVPAVTVSIAKKPGSNAVSLAALIEERVGALEGTVLPNDIHVTFTRNYGETAKEKSNELIMHVLLATVAVVLLMLFALGKREALVVAVAVPVTLALTLFASKLMGYTLNRVTLFALVFAIGILVDDAIVVVENIHRHFRLGWTDRRRAALFATDEVGNPTILATFAVIAALMPLAFVSGLMGPYMRPIPVNASVAMFVSLLVAFTVTPWVTLRVLGRHEPTEHRGPAAETKSEERIARIYERLMRPLLRRPKLRFGALAAVVLVLLASTGLLFVRAVRVKMLPFDNKSEFQVVIDMPEGTTLEQTASTALALAQVIAETPEVTDYQIYVGTSGPINFNGLVRHYFLREGPNVADIQVNLAAKHDRKRQSHDIAKSVRVALTAAGQRFGARVKVTEVPPGPPVLSTMVAEIYGPDLKRQVEVAAQVKQVFEQTPGVVDVDWYVEDPARTIEYEVDAERAALVGITPEMIARELRILGAGATVGTLHTVDAREPVPIVLQVSRAEREGLLALEGFALHAPDGRMVPLASLVIPRNRTLERSIYHKNLRRVTYVTGEVAGALESPVYGILDMKEEIRKLQIPEGYEIEQLYSHSPTSEERLRLKWDGEWQITYEVFRDMGIAFAAVMLLVYLLVVAWFRSFLTPLVIMSPIPLTLIGILPGHWVTGMFFTATSMIGFIALSGIIVRNSILLVDFINLQLEEGAPLEEAVLKAGAVRFRPIVLTAAALVVGGLVIVLDPIFQGLAVSLIFGVLVATALTLLVIPLLYYMQLRATGTR